MNARIVLAPNRAADKSSDGREVKRFAAAALRGSRKKAKKKDRD
jgi:hypothetical protein